MYFNLLTRPLPKKLLPQQQLQTALAAAKLISASYELIPGFRESIDTMPADLLKPLEGLCENIETDVKIRSFKYVLELYNKSLENYAYENGLEDDNRLQKLQKVTKQFESCFNDNFDVKIINKQLDKPNTRNKNKVDCRIDEEKLDKALEAAIQIVNGNYLSFTPFIALEKVKTNETRERAIQEFEKKRFDKFDLKNQLKSRRMAALDLAIIPERKPQIEEEIRISALDLAVEKNIYTLRK